MTSRAWAFATLLGAVLAAAIFFAMVIIHRQLEQYEKQEGQRERYLRGMYVNIPRPVLFVFSIGTVVLLYQLFAWYFCTWVAGLVGAVIGLLIPARAVRALRQRYLDKIEEQFPAALNVLANSVAAGLGLRQAIAEAARESPPPLSHELRRVGEEQSDLSYPIAVAVEHLAQRLQTEDTRLFSAAVSLNRKAGIGLREVLTTLAGTIRERQRLRGKIKALTAHGRLQALLVALIPFGAFLLMSQIDSEMTSRMFKIMLGPISLGRVVLAAVLFIEFIAFFWIRRIVAIDI